MMAEVSFETKRNPERCEAYRCQHSTKGMYKGQLEALPRPGAAICHGGQCSLQGFTESL